MWHDAFPDNPVRITINLSAQQFLNMELSKNIIDTVDGQKLDPATIGFEITESSFMEDRDVANTTLLTLKGHDFPLYLDDFGTGYSSLSYLLSFPVNVLKIDKSFVEWMHIDEQSSEIVKSVTALAHNMKMRVVAEGIESKEHCVMAKDFGCDYGQGYFFSRPLPPEEATEFIRNASEKTFC
jgi:EAL domain-containing protein (putative c-di-GMP-specific phosphodiesterase class I)